MYFLQRIIVPFITNFKIYTSVRSILKCLVFKSTLLGTHTIIYVRAVIDFERAGYFVKQDIIHYCFYSAVPRNLKKSIKTLLQMTIYRYMKFKDSVISKYSKRNPYCRGIKDKIPTPWGTGRVIITRIKEQHFCLLCYIL